MSAQVFPAISPSAKLPAVVAVIEERDYGPSDGEGSANCPHCGALGRYVIIFICEDGSKRGAMRGCFKLFPGSNSPAARLVQEAFTRQRQAKADRKTLASWWADMIAAAETLSRGPEAVQAFLGAVNAAESRRQAWLSRKGFGRFRRSR